MALVTGLLTRLAGFGLAIVMAGAICIAHLAGGFFLPAGFEFVFALLGSAVTLALTGAGPWSIDAYLAQRRPDAGAEVRSVRRAA